ncbi:FadR/GntR family transcriptional regulator [Deltaproteobacteria bacterium TL4]
MKEALGPIKKVKASEQVAEMLRQYILGGEIHPGEMLPPERTLAENFQVTRTTLREALKKLEQLKLIVIHQGQGITVKDFRNASMDLLTYLLNKDDQIDIKIFKDIMAARVLIGCEIVRCAAKRASESEKERLKNILDQMAQAKNHSEYLIVDFEFFRQLSIASNNMVYILIMNTIKTIYEKNLNLFDNLAVEQNITLQQNIYQAILDGKEDQAVEYARQYLTKGMKFL